MEGIIKRGGLAKPGRWSGGNGEHVYLVYVFGGFARRYPLNSSASLAKLARRTHSAQRRRMWVKLESVRPEKGNWLGMAINEWEHVGEPTGFTWPPAQGENIYQGGDHGGRMSSYSSIYADTTIIT